MNCIKLDSDFYNKFEEYFDSNIDKAKDHIMGRGDFYFTMEIRNRVIISYGWGNTWKQVVDQITEDITVEERTIIAMIILVLLDKDEFELNKQEQDMGTRVEVDTTYSVDDEPVKSWDEYFFNIAKQAARNSKCLSRKIGAVLVKDKSVISTGYNGPPRGIPTCDKRWKMDHQFIETYFTKDYDWERDLKGKCPRYVIGAKSGEKMHLCVAGHAEENSILNCARLGISTKDTTMYMTCGIPCSKCMIKIINAGVKELVVTGYTFYDESARYLLENSDIKIRLFDFML